MKDTIRALINQHPDASVDPTPHETGVRFTAAPDIEGIVDFVDIEEIGDPHFCVWADICQHTDTSVERHFEYEIPDALSTVITRLRHA